MAIGFLRRVLACRRGASAIEFAFAVPVLAVMLLGMSEYGLRSHAMLELSGAVRVGAQKAMNGEKDLEKIKSIVRASIPFESNDINVAAELDCFCGEATNACNLPCNGNTPPELRLTLAADAVVASILHDNQIVRARTMVRLR